jgi:hypothetical protein
MIRHKLKWIYFVDIAQKILKAIYAKRRSLVVKIHGLSIFTEDLLKTRSGSLTNTKDKACVMSILFKRGYDVS